MVGMFDSCFSLTSLDVSNFDTSKITIMGAMFAGCESLTSLATGSAFTQKNSTGKATLPMAMFEDNSTPRDSGYTLDEGQHTYTLSVMPAVVTVPKSVKWAGMPAGRVDATVRLPVTVSHAAAWNIAVSGNATALTDGHTELAASVASSSSPLAFDGDGTRADVLALSGSAPTAGKWTGRVQYEVKVSRKG